MREPPALVAGRLGLVRSELVRQRRSCARNHKMGEVHDRRSEAVVHAGAALPLQRLRVVDATSGRRFAHEALVVVICPGLVDTARLAP
jgi:hypothetical protein